MKEATGELNMTVVTVVAIAAVGAFFYAFVWPTIRNSIIASTNCASAQCNQDSCNDNNGNTTCTQCYYGPTFTEGPITCVFNGGTAATNNTGAAGGTGGTDVTP